MILSQIRTYFSDHRVASLTDLSAHFNVDPDAMRGMLGQWERKGKVRKAERGACSSPGSKSCGSDHLEFYEWIG